MPAAVPEPGAARAGDHGVSEGRGPANAPVAIPEPRADTGAVEVRAGSRGIQRERAGLAAWLARAKKLASPVSKIGGMAAWALTGKKFDS